MSRIINLTEGMRFGAGVDTHTEEVRGIPIEFDGESYGNGGQKVDASIKVIDSQESLMKSMNLSVNVSVRYGLASANASFEMMQESTVNQYSLYVLMTVSVRNPPRYMKNPRLGAQAQGIYARDPEEFRRTFGETYIDEIYSGGDFYGLFTFNTYDERNRTDLKASLDASVGGLFMGGDISASFASTVEEAKRHSSMDIRASMSGGSGLKNPRTLDELMQLYTDFNAKVQTNPVDFRASIKDFQYLPLPPGPTFAEQAVRRDTIDSSARRILDGIRQRGDIEFALRFPDQFQAPDLPALKAAYQAIDDQLPKLAQRARDCAQDIDRCSLAGLEPLAFQMPKRKLDAGDPLEVKWHWVQDHQDARAAAWFPASGMHTPFDRSDDGPRGGRFKLFHDAAGNVISGIFWHPDLGANIVYGSIMQAYRGQGMCEGPLGYPKSDEATLTGPGSDGLDRISLFEKGLLWWDAQSGKVSDRRPPDLRLIELAGGLRLDVATAVRAPSREALVRRVLRPVALHR